ncbi:unnamed protein product [Lactuca saligna]|uniref:ETFB lysine methyltransferase n=1 Tax=Lactuca saligna TaxID=75948 RepID=A0AA36EGB1_LACSI|nr:unnamed protein product [Lactuca saligna]
MSLYSRTITNMSMLLSSFRSHFFKQLACTSFSSIRGTASLASGSSSILFGSTKDYPSRNLTDFLNLSSVHAAFSTSSSNSESPTTGSYLSVDIQCRQDVADMLSEALLCFGATSTTMVEPDTCDSNDEVSIGSIFLVSQDVHQSITFAANSIGLKETPVYKVTTGYQSDWIENSRESFHPIEVKEGVWIIPEWITPPDLQATIITLNPGLAFGTGDHPTTKLCLLLLHDLIKGGETVLDYGTGSGILAIAALKFGAAKSVGFDIDPQAITAAHYNAVLNNIGPKNLELRLVPSNPNDTGSSREEWNWAMKSEEELDGNGIIDEKEKYDVVIGNILLNPLLDLADEIVSYAKPGGVVGLSGIILEQVSTVVDRYSNLLEGVTVSKIDDWACIRGTKRNA